MKFCSKKYLTHLEIIRKGENFAIRDLKGGLKLGNIHEGIEATNGILHFGMRYISSTWDPNIRKGDNLASLDKKGTVD